MSALYVSLLFLPMYVALFWAVNLILVPGKRNRAKHFLGVFMFAAAILYFSHAIYFSHEYRAYLVADTFYILANLSVFPLYLYFIKLLTNEHNYRITLFWYLFPAFFIALLTGTIYLYMIDALEYIKQVHYEKRFPFCQFENRWWKLQFSVNLLAKVLFFFQVIWVIVSGIKLIKAYENRVMNFYSNIEGRSVNWVFWLIIIFSITGLMSTIANFLGRSFFVANQGLVLIPVFVFGVLLFIIGYLGNMQRHTVVDLQLDEGEHIQDIFLNERADNQHKNDILNDSRKSKALLKTQLIGLFERDKVYQRTDLKITHLAELLRTNRTYVSRLINEEFNCSFNEYVNSYRVHAAKLLISENDRENVLLTLEQVAEKTGFSSASALIRIFKHHYGVTPGVFRNSDSGK